MNNKGQMAGVGALLGIFIGVVAALALYGVIAEGIGDSTQTQTHINKTYNFPQIGSSITLDGQAVVGTPIVINSTSFAAVPSSNYSINNYQLVNGNLAVTLTALSNSYNGTAVNITYTYEPLGYAKESGTRSMIQLIAIFSALGIVAFALFKAYENGGFDKFTK